MQVVRRMRDAMTGIFTEILIHKLMIGSSFFSRAEVGPLGLKMIQQGQNSCFFLPFDEAA
jgi:hypothetical protein